MEATRGRLSGALGVSVALHVGLALIAIVLMSVHSGQVATQPPPVRLQLYYVPNVGPSGGGGGNPLPAPPRPIQVPPHEQPPVVAITPAPAAVEPPRPAIDALVRTDMTNVLQFSGPGVTQLAAPGGSGASTGAGPGSGPGLGPGFGGNTGGGPRRAGGDVLAPTLLRSVEPRYTSEAMMAKVQGTVELEAVVLANGTVGDIRVTRSLDRRNGLDVEAIRAAKQWLFRPGTQNGRPIDVIVTLILDFRIH